jgi:3D (Asp-Asp-Asp) domain-containing protein
MKFKRILVISEAALLLGLFSIAGFPGIFTETTAATPHQERFASPLELPDPYQVTPDMELPEPQDADYQRFEATAYCDSGITFSGLLVRRGIVAADPEILPIGSIIDVRAGDYSGIYVVMDTGGKVKGKIIDIYMPNYDEAMEFGRQPVVVKVLRHGWHPESTSGMEYTEAG